MKLCALTLVIFHSTSCHISSQETFSTEGSTISCSVLYTSKIISVVYGNDFLSFSPVSQEESKRQNIAAASPGLSDSAIAADEAIAAALAATIAEEEAVPIDENLFVDDDLDEIDEDIEKLEL